MVVIFSIFIRIFELIYKSLADRFDEGVEDILFFLDMHVYERVVTQVYLTVSPYTCKCFPNTPGS